MQQNYTIFIKNRPLRIIRGTSMEQQVAIRTDTGIERLEPNKKFHEHLKNYIGQLMKGVITHLDVIGESPSGLLEEVKSCFDKQIAAAGGAVFNKKDELLCIYRLGCWDLPKGKVEPGEKPLETALREVKEETGLKHLEAGQALPDTYHVYELHSKTILKTTHWFIMHTSDKTLIPQLEEDITRADWIGPAQIEMVYQNTYENIKFVVAEAMRTISL